MKPTGTGHVALDLRFDIASSSYQRTEIVDRRLGNTPRYRIAGSPAVLALDDDGASEAELVSLRTRRYLAAVDIPGLRSLQVGKLGEKPMRGGTARPSSTV